MAITRMPVVFASISRAAPGGEPHLPARRGPSSARNRHVVRAAGDHEPRPALSSADGSSELTELTGYPTLRRSRRRRRRVVRRMEHREGSRRTPPRDLVSFAEVRGNRATRRHGAVMGVTDAFDDFQRRHEWAGAPLAVIYKFHDDQGVYLAALIAFYGFLSLFPLLLLFTTILGFVLQNDAELQARVLDSTLRQFPVIGQQLGDPQSVRGSGIALVVSVAVAIYGALGVAHAIQHAMNVTWAVPRCHRPNPFHLRLRSLMLIAIGGLATMLATVLSGLASSATSFGADLDWLTRRLHRCRRDRRQHRGVRRRLLDLRADQPVDAQPPARRTHCRRCWQALQLGGTEQYGTGTR